MFAVVADIFAKAAFDGHSVNITKNNLIEIAKKYNIEVLGIVGEDGFQPGDYVIKGTKKDLLDFCDGALHPDYLYHENEFDTDVIVEDDEFFDMGTALKNAFRKIKGVEIVDESLHSCYLLCCFRTRSAAQE